VVLMLLEQLQPGLKQFFQLWIFGIRYERALKSAIDGLLLM
jgi:hypothetical protein